MAVGILDELKKLTKPYNDEDYLEEDLQDPVRVAPQDNRSYASYAEAPRPQEPAQTARRPYVFSQPQQAQGQQGYYDQGAYQQPQQGYQQAAYQQGQQGGLNEPGQDFFLLLPGDSHPSCLAIHHCQYRA